jgi:hypothetical protein
MSSILVTATFDLAGVQQAVNTFHFTGPGTYSADEANAEAVVRGLYGTTPAGVSRPLGAWMASWVQRVYTTRTYDLSVPPPRSPVVRAANLPAAAEPAGNNTVPYDCAMVVTHLGAPPPSPRKRGRTYLTGLSANWFAPGGVSTPVLFATGTGTALDVALRAFAAMRLSVNVTWVIRSEATVPALDTPVASDYVDLEPDTQRRRGVEGTTRVLGP